jgi:hypothetical protein
MPMGTPGADGRALFDNYIKLNWPGEVKAAGVKKKNNTACVPVARNISLLRKDVNALDEAIRIWRENDAERMAPGYEAIAEQAGVESTWEYKLVERGQPWEQDVPADVRARVEKVLGTELEKLRQRTAEEQARVESIRRDMRAGRRARIKLPGE